MLVHSSEYSLISDRQQESSMEQISYFVVEFDPVAFSVFGWGIHWYGISYLIGLVGGWGLARYLVRRHPLWKINAAQVDDLLFYIGLGVVLGGRLGYVLFYDLGNLFDQPNMWQALLRVVSIHEGGMSFHGGFLGCMLAMWLFCRKYQHRYFVIVDLLAMVAPLGLFSGRIANFVNGELWGKPAEMSWAMIFPKIDMLPRHPTPLYEALLEGIVLFALLWWIARKPQPVMVISGWFAVGYGVFRTFVEFFREPDAHIGYLLGDWLTMGMVLSLPLVMVGLVLLIQGYRQRLFAGQ